MCREKLPTDLFEITALLRKVGREKGWNEANLVLELCDKAEKLWYAASQALYMMPIGQPETQQLQQVVGSLREHIIIMRKIKTEGDK